MKKIILLTILLASTIWSCKKESEPAAPCVTCTETVYFNEAGHQQQVSVASQNTYCNGEQKDVVQGTTNSSGTNSDGSHWTRRTEMICK